MKKILAKLKILRSLAAGYLGMWVYIYIIIDAFKITMASWFFPGFLVFCLIATIVDWIWIFPEEQRILWNRNPAFKELKNK